MDVRARDSSDGLDDLIIGSPGLNVISDEGDGAVYVVLGASLP